MRHFSLLLLVFGTCGLAQSTLQAQVDFSVDQITKHGTDVHIRVRNLGESKSAPTKLTVWLTDNQTKNAFADKLITVSPINARGSRTLVMRIPDQRSVMRQEILVTARIDSTGSVPESNERNNVLQRVLKSTSRPPTTGEPNQPNLPANLPDLAIRNVSKRGNDFIVKVANLGNRRSKASTLATWVVDKQTQKSTKVQRYVPPIDVGSVAQVVVDRIPAAQGNIKVTTIVDVFDNQVERNERNNRREITMAQAKPVKAQADLITLSIDVKSARRIETVIYNQGSGTTKRRFRVRLEVVERDGGKRLYFSRQYCPALGARQKHTLKFETEKPLGSKQMIQVNVDFDNSVRETNERNNKTFQVF